VVIVPGVASFGAFFWPCVTGLLDSAPWKCSCGGEESK
jgi:hypothetical protein